LRHAELTKEHFSLQRRQSHSIKINQFLRIAGHAKFDLQYRWRRYWSISQRSIGRNHPAPGIECRLLIESKRPVTEFETRVLPTQLLVRESTKRKTRSQPVVAGS